MNISDVPHEEVDGEPTLQSPEPQTDEQYWTSLMERGEIHKTTIDDCDLCEATGEVHWLGPNGGVIALCVDLHACRERRNALDEAGERAAHDALRDEHDTRPPPVEASDSRP